MSISSTGTPQQQPAASPAATKSPRANVTPTSEAPPFARAASSSSQTPKTSLGSHDSISVGGHHGRKHHGIG